MTKSIPIVIKIKYVHKLEIIIIDNYNSWQVKSILQVIPSKNRNRIDSIFKPKSRNRLENSIPTFRY